MIGNRRNMKRLPGTVRKYGSLNLDTVERMMVACRYHKCINKK